MVVVWFTQWTWFKWCVLQVEARNELESYAYSLKNQIGDKEKLGGKLDDEDKKTIETAVDEAISWLDSNKEAGVEELQVGTVAMSLIVRTVL